MLKVQRFAIKVLNLGESLTKLKTITTMPALEFYQVRSRKSAESVNGLRQISLACDGHPDIHGFLWFDEAGGLRYLQFLFDEQVLEWKAGQGFRCSSTNREAQQLFEVGRNKGARTVGEGLEAEALAPRVAQLREAEFPAELQEALTQVLQAWR